MVPAGTDTTSGPSCSVEIVTPSSLDPSSSSSSSGRKKSLRYMFDPSLRKFQRLEQFTLKTGSRLAAHLSSPPSSLSRPPHITLADNQHLMPFHLFHQEPIASWGKISIAHHQKTAQEDSSSSSSSSSSVDGSMKQKKLPFTAKNIVECVSPSFSFFFSLVLIP